ncbi:MAG TPA: nitrilase-related carbon-nitrogen hydrolase, partial [Thermoanaerobaculia bacterium]
MTEASPSGRRFRVGLVQMRCGVDPAANLARAAAKVEEAARSGAELVCLPELFRSRYFCQKEDPASFDLAEPVPGPTTERLADAARKSGVAVIAPVFEKRAPGLYHNSAAVLDSDGRIAGVYRKMHIPDDPA